MGQDSELNPPPFDARAGMAAFEVVSATLPASSASSGPFRHQAPTMHHVAFVVPFVFETSLRFLRGALALQETRVGLISQDPLEKFDPEIRQHLAGYWQVKDVFDVEQLAAATRGIAKQIGRVERLLGVLEQLQVPLADARERLGLPGLHGEAARNFRDKARMKDVLRQHGIGCAHHQLCTAPAEALAFVERVGFPVVVKPPAGAGAVNTARLDSAQDLAEALRNFPPHPAKPVLFEEFILGDEHSFDCVTIDGRPAWHSISRYFPGPLEVMQNPWIQWVVLLPRRVDGPEFDGIRRSGVAALAALGADTALSHMEWFRRKDGSVAISEVGARPPGAQFTSLMSWCHDVDMYKAWARLVVTDQFDPPQRKFACGAAYFRGQGQGKVKAIHGLDVAQRELSELVVEVKLPKQGQAQSSSYEGEGFAILRHPETAVVEQALKRLVQLVRVELS